MRDASPLIIAARLYINPSWVYGTWLLDKWYCVLLEVVCSGKRGFEGDMSMVRYLKAMRCVCFTHVKGGIISRL